MAKDALLAHAMGLAARQFGHVEEANAMLGLLTAGSSSSGGSDAVDLAVDALKQFE